MRRARLLALGALTAAAAALAYTLLVSPARYTVTATVEDAGQLVPGNDVRMGAVTVGKVASIRLTDAGLAQIKLEIDDGAAPLRDGTTATIRSFSTVAAASRFVVLGPPAFTRGRARSIPDGGAIPLRDTTAPVDFDAFLNAFDGRTRTGFRQLVSGEAEIYDGTAPQARVSLERSAPALSASRGVAEQLVRDRPAFTALVRSAATTAGAVAAHRRQLAELVDRAGTTAAALAGQAGALREGLQRLPPTLRTATSTFADVRNALDDVDRMVSVARPATRRLTPLLKRLDPVLREGRVTVPALAAIVRTPGAANDLTDVLLDAPALKGASDGAFARLVRTMDRSQGQLDSLRAYTPDLLASLSNVGQAASYYDANGHYLRAQPVMAPYTYDADSNVLAPTPGNDRLAGFQTVKDRCPGSALPALADGSAPVLSAGCLLSATPVAP